MKALRISLLFMGVAAVIRIITLFAYSYDFWYNLTSFHVIWPLVDIAQVFVSAFITCLIAMPATRNTPMVKALILRTLLFALVFGLLNELFLTVLYSYTPEMTAEFKDSRLTHQLNNLLGQTAKAVYTGGLFVLTWIIWESKYETNEHRFKNTLD